VVILLGFHTKIAVITVSLFRVDAARGYGFLEGIGLSLMMLQIETKTARRTKSV
jgi:hypothetical protein